MNRPRRAAASSRSAAGTDPPSPSIRNSPPEAPDHPRARSIDPFRYAVKSVPARRSGRRQACPRRKCRSQRRPAEPPQDKIARVVTAGVSIRAPAWGATRCGWPTATRCSGFNPRPRMGGDHRSQPRRRPPVVSIRAPAWGATAPPPALPPSSPPVSIRAPAWGATPACRRMARLVAFQSAAPHGGRRAPSAHIPGPLGFQSTPPHGGRLRHTGDGQRDECFNPPPGPRQKPAPSHQYLAVSGAFQSAPPHGGRPLGFKSKTAYMRVSIRAPAWGATSVASDQVNYLGFQSAPPHGGRLEPEPVP